ncbi:MAG: DUF4430 domain-containing protein [Acutalibacteraceae bacterium]
MKTFKKTLSVILCAVMLLCCMASLAFAAGDNATVKLRIEGIESCLYYADVTVKNGSTAYDVLKTADENSNDITVTAYDSVYGKYIAGINDIFAGSYTSDQWDGWLYRVNSVEPEVSADSFTVSDGDSIVFYYGDPYNTGMQYPTAKTDKLSDGKLYFTSLDTVYDENWNAITKEVVVTGYTLIWGWGDGQTMEITPDENGICTIPDVVLTDGEHSVQIVRNDSATGLPTVLRFAPDYTVTVKEPTSFFAKIFSFFQKIFNAIKKLLGIVDR